MNKESKEMLEKMNPVKEAIGAEKQNYDPMKGFEMLPEENIQELLSILNNPEDPRTLSRISNPISYAIVHTKADFLEAKGLIGSANFIRNFLEHSLLYSLSKQGKSRQESVTIATGLEAEKADPTYVKLIENQKK